MVSKFKTFFYLNKVVGTVVGCAATPTPTRPTSRRVAYRLANVLHVQAATDGMALMCDACWRRTHPVADGRGGG